MNKKDYHRHIIAACKREQEEKAEAQNKIDVEILYMQMEDSRDMYRLKCEEL